MATRLIIVKRTNNNNNGHPRSVETYFWRRNRFRFENETSAQVVGNHVVDPRHQHVLYVSIVRHPVR